METREGTNLSKIFVNKGDYISYGPMLFYNNTPCARLVLLLIDKDTQKAKEIFSKKNFNWVIYKCKLFKFAEKTKNFNLNKLFVDLLSKELNEPLCCESLIKLLKERRIPVPPEVDCFSCPHLTMRSQISPKKKLL